MISINSTATQPTHAANCETTEQLKIKRYVHYCTILPCQHARAPCLHYVIKIPSQGISRTDEHLAKIYVLPKSVSHSSSPSVCSGGCIFLSAFANHKLGNMLIPFPPWCWRQRISWKHQKWVITSLASEAKLLSMKPSRGLLG